MKPARQYFSQVKIDGKSIARRLGKRQPLSDFARAIEILDYLHIEAGLLAPYNADYPLVEPRELIPSFDAPMVEYKHLPAFSMVILDRAISYQDEWFQFDLLEPEGRPPDPSISARNRALMRRRLPSNLMEYTDKVLGRKALTPLGRYRSLLPLTMQMDRGHILARDPNQCFYLAGIYASFPADLDGEIKRFGRKIGKFIPGDNQRYAQNRPFVYRLYMEKSGFPICGERHTSAALFSRRLLRRRQRFMVKVLGTSDRAITSLSSQGSSGLLPAVDKTALVAVRLDDSESIERLTQGGFFLDPARRVVILRVRYLHHRYHPENVLEDRGLSVAGQEVIHPQTGEVISDMDILGLSQDRLLMLNDIVRGEFTGAISYHGRETVMGTADIADRLKFLSAWLEKHRHILADYSPDNFTRVLRVISSFLDEVEAGDDLERCGELYRQARDIVEELRLAHRLRLLEKLVSNRADAYGRKLHHIQILIILNHVLSTEGPDLAQNHPRSLGKLLHICRREMDNPYIKRRLQVVSKPTPSQRHLAGEYHRLIEQVVDLEAACAPPCSS
jgi:hypothetical protein